MKRLPDSMQIKWLILPILLLVSVIGLWGCSQACEEPAMLRSKPRIAKNAAEKVRFETLSNDNAKLGWHDIFEGYYKTRDFNDLKSAAMFFNYCWQWNPGNYNAYWGWGIIRGLQAELVQDPQTAEVRLNESIGFLHQTKDYSLPDGEADNLDLDLANAYNSLGSFYLSQSRPQAAAAVLNDAKIILESILSRRPNHGRACYLLAANCLSRQDPAAAKLNADNAVRNGFKIPESFLKRMK